MTQATQGFVDPFGSAPAEQSGGEPMPTLRTLGVGRLVVVVPLKVERDIPNTGQFAAVKPLVDRLTADVIPCDGMPIMFGGDPDAGKPDILGPWPVGKPMPRAWISSGWFCDTLEPEIGKRPVIGRLAKRPPKSGKGRPFWVLDFESITVADKMTAAPMLQAYQAGLMATPQPAPVAAPAPTYAPSPAYVAPAYPQAVQAAPVAVGHWTDAHSAPAGLEALWSTLTVEQKTAVLANVGIHGPAVAGVPGI